MEAILFLRFWLCCIFYQRQIYLFSVSPRFKSVEGRK